MEWLKGLHGKVIGLDTAPLIYFIEDHPDYSQVIQPFFNALANGDFQVITSTITFLEVLVHPIRSGNHELVEQYQNVLLNASELVTLPVTTDIAEIAAKVRAEHNLRTPDAIQIATAVHAGCSHFFTNDERITRVREIEVMTLSRLIKQNKSL